MCKHLSTQLDQNASMPNSYVTFKSVEAKPDPDCAASQAFNSWKNEFYKDSIYMDYFVKHNTIG